MDLWDVALEVFDGLIRKIAAKDKNNILKVLLPELLEHIFKFLPQSDLFSVRLVCKKFYEAATSPQVLKLDLRNRYLEVKELEVEVLQPILKNVTGVTVYNIKEEEAEESALFFKKLEEQYTNLKMLTIAFGRIPSNITIENIVEKIESLIMITVHFKNASYFFRTGPKNPVYRNIQIFMMFSCSGFKDVEAPFVGISVAPMRKIRELNLSGVRELFDRDYVHLKDSIANVSSLTLSKATIKLETFQQMDLRKLKNLYLTHCCLSDDWLSIMKNLRELETLCLMDVTTTSTFSYKCPGTTFQKLNKIKSFSMNGCNIDNQTVAAVAGHLPNLVTWEMSPNEYGNVTDTSLLNLIIHEHLEEIRFDCVQLGGFSLRQIARCAPIIKQLTVADCAAEDDDMEVFETHFSNITRLYLSGLRITDAGATKLIPRLGSLKTFFIESRSLTGAGMRSTLRFLNSAECIGIKFGVPQSSFGYSHSDDDSNNKKLSFYGPSITRGLLMSLTEQLCKYNANVLSLENMAIGVEDVQHFVKTLTKLENMSITECALDEETTELFFIKFKNLTTLNLTRCHLTMNGFLKLFRGIGTRKINKITIENESMLDEETLLTVLPLLTTVTNVMVHTLSYEQQMSLDTLKDCQESKEIIFRGMSQINDDTLSKVMTSYYEVGHLILADTSVTAKGIAEIAAHLTKLTYLRIISNVMGDDVMEVIGRHFSNLKTLQIEGELVTDVGLGALGKHLESLDTLNVVHSGITNGGVKKIAPLLKTVINLDLYSGNKKVTAELLAFMRETYPNITHTTDANYQVVEDESGEEVDQVEADGDVDVAAQLLHAEGGNEDVANVVQPEEACEVPPCPGQPEGHIVFPGEVNLEAVNPVFLESPNDVATNSVFQERGYNVASVEL